MTGMTFPVDKLNSYSHEDLQSSGEEYLTDLRYRNPNNVEFFTLPDHRKIPIRLSTVGFVPLYGEEQTHKVLALFAPRDLFTAVALYLDGRWWSIDDIVKTSVPTRQGLHQVKSLGERIVLYVLNRIIYRTQEMERNDIPFLCHGANDYVKIMWKKGEAIGFYSVKPAGSACSSYGSKTYKMSVLDTIFVRRRHRGKDYGLIILEDFVKCFPERALGLRYPLSAFTYTACKRYLEKYPEDHKLLWEVQGPGCWFQRANIMSMIQKENMPKIAAQASKKENKNVQAVDNFQPPEASGQNTDLVTQPNADSQKSKESIDVHASTSKAPASLLWTQGTYLKRPRIRKCSQESQPETSQGAEENVPHVSESRLELPAHTSEKSEDLKEVPEESTAEKNEEMIFENEGQSVSEAELHVSTPEKPSEEEETPSEPLNGEITDETGKTSLVAEEETADEVLSGELTLLVPLILEPPTKPSEDTVSEKVLSASGSEVLSEESALVEGTTEEEQESGKTTIENAAASASKEEPSDNGLPNSTVNEAAEESVSENVPPKPASSLEDQNEEAGHNSQEAPAALSQSSLIVVELEGVSFQQPSGQEGQKNQLEEHSEESEQIDQYMQATAERAADSSSEEAEIEVPIVDRRNLRRKAKGYKGPPKKKGKPA
ncbi:soluble lamin-associated protein of 75 kDa isoform X2 [Larus michahellis]|uniref:soluble lamin-associated protein of 75 kDa isoform X2 n=1 Tax=Larus michahellis TaxID=119627 RepID=UPI003D9BE979